MNVIKTKLRNRLAVSLVEALLLVRTGMKRKGQDCTTFVPLPCSSDSIRMCTVSAKRLRIQRNHQKNASLPIYLKTIKI